MLVRAEQGYGDTLQCARFIPLLLTDEVRVVVRMQAGTSPVVRRLAGSVELTTPEHPVEGVTREIGMLSLPALLHVTPYTIPSRVPYLHAPDGSVGHMAAAVQCRTPGACTSALLPREIPHHTNDRNRSIPQQ